MFMSRRRLRSLAAGMLLVWLGALGAGTVNACIGPPAGLHLPDTGLHAGPAGTSGQHAPPVDGPSGPMPAAPSDGPTACGQFCGDQSAGLSVVAPPASALAAAGLALLPSLGLALQRARPFPGPWITGPGQGPPAVAVPIAFLRLVL